MNPHGTFVTVSSETNWSVLHASYVMRIRGQRRFLVADWFYLPFCVSVLRETFGHGPAHRAFVAVDTTSCPGLIMS